MTDDDMKALFDDLEADPAPGFVSLLRRRLVEESDAGTAVTGGRPGAPAVGVLRLTWRPRRWRAVMAAAAAVTVVVAVSTLWSLDDRPQQQVDAGPAAPSGEAPPVPTTSIPAAPVDIYVGIWPFASMADATTYEASGATTFRDPQATAREFARVYLGMNDQADFAQQRTGLRTDTAVVPVGSRLGEGGRLLADPQPASFVTLVQPFGTQVWSVVAARAPRIMPAHEFSEGGYFPPTMRVTGEANAFEGTIDVEIREDGMVAGEALGRGFVTGSGASDGSLGPFDGEIAFTEPTRMRGAVIWSERSAADGRLLQVAVVGIVFDRPTN